jgi:nucleoside-diphosphate-sugar epimerase
MMDDFNNGALQLNYDKILADPTFSAVAKQVLVSLQRQPYMTLGEFFSKLTNTDLTALNFTVELAYEHEDPQALSDLIVIVHALASAEGITPANDQEATDNINYFGTLVTCESLARKGVVRVFHENFTFGQEFRERPIAERVL